MILYNPNTCRNGNCGPLYPAWIRSENYDQCEGFFAEYSGPAKRIHFSLFRKAGAFLTMLERHRKAESRGGTAETVTAK